MAMRLLSTALAVAFVALFLCGTSKQESTVNLSAVSSLTNALQDIDATFTKSTGVTVLPTFGATSVLARQLERSSTPAVFISADQQWMDYAGNRLPDGP
jgi:molybdate transport system substrate-binding protein